VADAAANQRAVISTRLHKIIPLATPGIERLVVRTNKANGRHAGQPDAASQRNHKKCEDLLAKPYCGLLGARNWELIQPFMRVLSTWTQSPSRPEAVNCEPLGAVPRTGAFPEGADLMFTPGRCKKTTSGLSEAATSGEGTAPVAPRDGSTSVTLGTGSTGVADDVSPLIEEEGSGNCTAAAEDSAVSSGTFAADEA